MPRLGSMKKELSMMISGINKQSGDIILQYKVVAFKFEEVFAKIKEYADNLDIIEIVSLKPKLK